MLELLKIVVFSFVRCWHLNKGPIITCRLGQPRSAVASITGTYVVCLDCGKEYAYDLETGHLIDPEPGRVRVISRKIVELCRRKPALLCEPGTRDPLAAEAIKKALFDR